MADPFAQPLALPLYPKPLWYRLSAPVRGRKRLRYRIPLPFPPPAAALAAVHDLVDRGRERAHHAAADLRLLHAAGHGDLHEFLARALEDVADERDPPGARR